MEMKIYYIYSTSFIIYQKWTVSIWCLYLYNVSSTNFE